MPQKGRRRGSAEQPPVEQPPAGQPPAELWPERFHRLGNLPGSCCLKINARSYSSLQPSLDSMWNSRYSLEGHPESDSRVSPIPVIITIRGSWFRRRPKVVPESPRAPFPVRFQTKDLP